MTRFRPTKVRGAILPAVILITSIGSRTDAVQADDILGSWITEGHPSRVEIYKGDDVYYGRLVSVFGADSTRRDARNPDRSLRDRSILGLTLLSDLRFDQDEWTGGRIYDPTSGRTYRCKVTVEGDGKLHLRGYVGISLVGRTTVWERVTSYLNEQLRFLGIPDSAALGPRGEIDLHSLPDRGRHRSF